MLLHMARSPPGVVGLQWLQTGVAKDLGWK